MFFYPRYNECMWCQRVCFAKKDCSLEMCTHMNFYRSISIEIPLKRLALSQKKNKIGIYLKIVSKTMKSARKSSILLHITSLPGPYGIGDFGPEAYKFVDFLHETKQKVWQILPLTPTEKCSPYSGISAFAGHPLLISLEKLVENGLLKQEDLILPSTYKFDDHSVKFQSVTKYKSSMFKKAFENFRNSQEKDNYSLEEFLQKKNYWLENYVLFMTIKEQENNRPWSEWPQALKTREKQALEQIRQERNDLLEYQIFLQFIFHQQWKELKQYANQFDIEILGDMPVYGDYDSADVWTNTHIFQIDNHTLLPTAVSGIFLAIEIKRL